MQAENTEDALEIKNSSIYTNKKIAASFINNLKEKIIIIIKNDNKNNTSFRNSGCTSQNQTLVPNMLIIYRYFHR